MSHYNAIATQIKDRDSLVAALIRKGFTRDQIEIHDTAQSLYGYQDDERKDKANVIIRRKHVGTASNDIGFKQQEDGTFKAIISDYDKGIGYNNAWLNDVSTLYNVEQAKTVLSKNGWTYTESTNAAGEIQLVGVSY